MNGSFLLLFFCLLLGCGVLFRVFRASQHPSRKIILGAILGALCGIMGGLLLSGILCPFLGLSRGTLPGMRSTGAGQVFVGLFVGLSFLGLPVGALIGMFLAKKWMK